MLNTPWHRKITSVGLKSVILNEILAMSIFEEVILRDPSQITISDSKMHLMKV